MTPTARGQTPPPVVCGISASPAAPRAAAAAASLADALGSALVLAYVRPSAASLPAVPVTAPVGTAAALDTEQRLAQEAEHMIRELVLDLGIEPDVLRICADTRVGDGLHRVVRDHSAQLLVLGSGSHSDLHATVLGSVTLDAFRDPVCPVVAVPPDARIPAFRTGASAHAEQSVVCAVDDSPAGHEALEVARVLASRLDAALVATHVVSGVPATAAAPASAAFGGVDLARAELAQQRRGRDLLDRAAERVGPRVRTRLCVGTPTAEAIAGVAQDEHAALIVVGTRGRGALRSALLGSVSRRLAAQAPVPVVVAAAGASRALRGS